MGTRFVVGVLLSSSPAILMGEGNIQGTGSSRNKLLWMCFVLLSNPIPSQKDEIQDYCPDPCNMNKKRGEISLGKLLCHIRSLMFPFHYFSVSPFFKFKTDKKSTKTSKPQENHSPMLSSKVLPISRHSSSCCHSLLSQKPPWVTDPCFVAVG